MRIAAKKPRNYIERSNQIKFIRWFKSTHPSFHRLISGYKVTSTDGFRGQLAQDEGLLKGYPDVFIAIPNGVYHGFYIEFKAIYETGRKGTLSAEQKEVHADLRMMNYQVSVCYSCDEAVQVWQEYFKGYFGTKESLI